MWLGWYFWMAGGAVLALCAWRLFRARKGARLLRVSSAIAFAALSFLALATGSYLAWWYSGRSEPVDRELFRGVRHVRIVSKDPRKIVANLLIVDLKEKSISFQVTVADSDIKPKLKAATVGQFLERTGAQVAMNANFFHPFHSKSPWDFYPRAGDPVEVLGIAASAGDLYSTQVWAGATIYFQQDDRVQIGGTVSNVWNAIAGDQWLVRGGTNVAKPDAFAVYPRAAAGLNAAGDELILASVDGKQPSFSEGMTLPELAELLKSRGAHDAVNLDGGGSVTLVAADSRGKPVVLNSPIHTRIPGRQRPVGNQLGIRVKR